MSRSAWTALFAVMVWGLSAFPSEAGPPRASWGFSFGFGSAGPYYPRSHYHSHPRHYHYPRSYSSFGIYVAPRPVYVAPRYVEPVYVVPAPGVIYEEEPYYDDLPPVTPAPRYAPPRPPYVPPAPRYVPPRPTLGAPAPQPPPITATPQVPNSRVPPPPPVPVTPQ